MIFNDHSKIVGMHAFLSPSSPQWLRYSEEKLSEVYINSKAKELGTRLHAYAAESISLGIKLPKSKKTLNMYVNDAIGYKMTPEQPLYFSENCFGTADAISFRDGILRIHDLKTGVTKPHMEQLEIYAALFCLEYKVDPSEIDMELRIYKSDEVLVHNPEANDISEIMNMITRLDKALRKLKQEDS